MNRMALESFANSGRRASVGSQIKNIGGGKAASGGDGDDPLDLFAKSTRTSDDDQIRLEKLAAGRGRIGRGMEDLFDSEIGKNDYDWLLTPPETPLYSSAVARESPLSSNALSREVPLSSVVLPATANETASSGKSSRAPGRSVSNTRPSRISTSHTDSSLPTRPVRSSSVTRSSISSSYSSSSFSYNRTSMLNTSSASITSSRSPTPSKILNRPVSKSTINARPSSSSTSARPSSTSAKPSSNSARPSTISKPSSTTNISRSSSSPNSSRPSSSSNSSSNARSSTCPVNSRVPTPTKTRPNPSSTSTTRSTSDMGPSTPNSSKSQTPSNSKLGSRANSRSSTPTRRPASSGGPSALIAASQIPAIKRDAAASSRNPTGPGSRSCSPSPRPRALVRPVDLPNFPTDAPPNLRTQLPARSASTGRTRLGMALTTCSNSSSDAPAASNKRNYAPPVGIRGRFPENSPKGSSTKSHESNGHKIASDNGLRRSAKPVSGTDSTGFGRNISKTSLDMALRHMDIRQGMNGLRTSSLFPQSIRSTSTKTQPTRKSDPIVPLSHDEFLLDSHGYNETVSPDCRSNIAFSKSDGFAPGSVKSPDRESPTNRDSELDLLNGSLRYDAFILKEENSNDMNWLHSVEDNSDQSPVFDHGFEPLPEPFGLL